VLSRAPASNAAHVSRTHKSLLWEQRYLSR